MVGATMVAEESTLDKFGALVMPIHQESDEHFVNIPHKTFAENRKDEIFLNNMYFGKAIAELHGKKIFQFKEGTL